MVKNFEKTFKVLRKNYVLVPLEIFKDNAYKTLISTIMSARTNDDITAVAAQKLFKKAPTLKKLSELEEGEIAKLIYPVGFYKTKAKNIKNLSIKILHDFDGKVPKTREKLVSLPGVGRKTANLVLNRAFGMPTIAVDTHVHKITNMLGWVKTKTPEQTEFALMEILPQKYWTETNKLFVSLGRQFRSKTKLEEFLRNNKLF